ncbi:MAG TPA: hypothetical protein DD670_08930, partial [Planctomycetaceae bacterium]|nr:hypothetical protein [Planctomycetaceae bacterium]
MFGVMRNQSTRWLKCLLWPLLLGFGGFLLPAAEVLAQTRLQPAAVHAQGQLASTTAETGDGPIAAQTSAEDGSASTAEATVGWMDRVDAFFGDYCVAPMQSVL